MNDVHTVIVVDDDDDSLGEDFYPGSATTETITTIINFVYRLFIILCIRGKLFICILVAKHCICSFNFPATDLLWPFLEPCY